MISTEEEVWVPVKGYPDYQISNFGRIYNRRTGREVSVSPTFSGHLKVNLFTGPGERSSRSVARLVAEAFIRPPNKLCDSVIVLNGNLSDVRAKNLMWRPRWYVWKYSRQLKEDQPEQYQNLPIRNLLTGDKYLSIIEAGMNEGLLFADIWRSATTGNFVFPYSVAFEFIDRWELSK
jgi:NUMOD4 motif